MKNTQTNTRCGIFPHVSAEDLTGLEGRLVTLSAQGVALQASSTVVQPYLLEDGAAAGEDSDVIPLTSERQQRITLKGTCAKGDTLVAADPSVEADKGKARAKPAAAGTYGIVGIAEEAGVDGQAVLFRPHAIGTTVTVAG